MFFYKNNAVITIVINSGNIRVKKLADYIFEKLPLEKPIKLIQRDLKDCFGYCLEQDDTYLIVIHKSAPYYVKIDTLLHEYAHAITMSNDKYKDRDENSQHNAYWGECYAKTYRTYLTFANRNKSGTDKDSEKSN